MVRKLWQQFIVQKRNDSSDDVGSGKLKGRRKKGLHRLKVDHRLCMKQACPADEPFWLQEEALIQTTKWGTFPLASIQKLPPSKSSLIESCRREWEGTGVGRNGRKRGNERRKLPNLSS